MSFETMASSSESAEAEEQIAEKNFKDLVRQFENPEKIDFNGRMVDVVDVAPEKRKTETPTLMIPGFSATPEALKDAILRTADRGRRVVSADAPHGIDTKDAPERDIDLPEAEMRKLELLLQLIEKKDFEKVNAIANSEGAIWLVTAALLYPEKFENIVLVEPAGLIGKDNFWALTKRTLVDNKKAENKQKKNEKIVEFPSRDSIGAKSMLSNLLGSIKEVKAISEADITDTLRQLHAAGIGISIIHAADDQVFPMEKVQEMVKEDMIDGFYSVRGTHNNIYFFEPYGLAAESALSALEHKQQLQQEKEKNGQ